MKEAGLRVTITKEDLEKAVDSINKKLLTIDKTMKGVTSNLTDLTNKAGLDISKMGDDAAKGFSKGTAALQKLNSEFGQKANLQSYLDLLKQVEGTLGKISKTTTGAGKAKLKTPAQSALLEEDIKKIQSGEKVQVLNIPQLQNAIATLNAQIGDTNSKLTLSQQQKLVDLRSYYAEELKLAKMSTDEQEKWLDKQIKQQEKADAEKVKSIKKSALSYKQERSLLSGNKVTNLNISQIKEAIGLIDNKIKESGSKLSIANQQKLTDLRSYYTEELRLSKLSSSEQEKFLNKQIENEERAKEKKLKLLNTTALRPQQSIDILSGSKLSGLNIPQLKDSIDLIDKQISNSSLKLSTSNQQKLVDLRKYYAEELKLAQKSTDEKQKELEKQAADLKKANDKKSKSNKRLSEQTPLYDYKNTDIAGIDAVNRSYNERVRLSKELTEYSRNLVKGTDEYAQKQAVVNKKIQELAVLNKNASTEGIKLEKTKRKIMDTAGQLTRRIALLFSVSQITRFVHEMIMVRGEFELQQRALQAILQDKDAADKLFGQITQLAIKSPFKTSELVSYTKQLAAYRIEEDKLYETTYRLADISAGLGVDMQRLILAFGQVKAANYLRGQELRQFSEAGINILGELAAQFSIVEGRAVSTGEVFERVSKRMVTFGDVEQVFKKLTDEGGIFYNMQEIQSETLKGKWLNLRDALDLMYNDMGKGNDGVLKNSIDTVKSMILNWENLAYWIKWAAGLLGTYKLASMAAAYATKNLGAVQIWGTKLTGEQARAVSSNAKELVLANGSVIKLTKSNISLAKGMRVVQGAITGVATSIMAMIPAAVILGIITLITKISEASRQAKRLRLELDKIKNESFDSFDTAAASLRELGKELENVVFGSKKHSDIVGKISNQYGEYIPFLFSEKSALDSITKSYDDILVSMKNVAHQRAYDKGVAAIESEYGDVETKNIAKLQKIVLDRYSFAGATVKDAAQIIRDWRKQLSSSEDDVQSFYNIMQKYFDKSIYDNSNVFSVLATEAKNVFLGRENEQIKQIAVLFEEITSAKKRLDQSLSGTFGDGFDTKKFNNELEATIANYDKLLEETKKGSIEEENLLIKKQVAILKLKNKAKLLSDADLKSQREALENWDKGLIGNINTKMKGYGEDLFKFLRIGPEEAKTSRDELIAAAKDQYEEAVKQVDILKNQRKSTPLTLIEEEDLKKQEKIVTGSLEKLTLLGGKIGTAIGGGGTTNKILENTKEQISAIGEAIKKYETYLKTVDAESSKSLTTSDFSSLFKKLKLEIPSDSDFSKEWGLSLLEGLAASLEDQEAQKEVQKAIRDIKLEIRVDISENELKDAQNKIDSLIEDFKLTSELKDLNLPTSWVSFVFGDEVTSISDIMKGGAKIIAELEEKGGTDRLAKAAEISQKLKEIEADTWKENIKTIATAAKKYQSVSISVKNVRDKYADLIQWVQDNVPSTEQDSIIANLLSLQDSEIAELQAEAFKATEIYAKMFGDIQSYGDYTLNYLINKAKEMTNEFSEITGVGAKFIKEDGKTKVSMSWKDEAGNIQQVTVSLSEYRGVLKQVLKLEEQVVGEGMFAKSIAGWKDVALASKNLGENTKKITKLQKELNKSMEDYFDARDKNPLDPKATKDEYEAYIAKQQELNKAREENKQLSSDEWEAISIAVHATAGEINNVINSYSFLSDLLGETGKEFVSTFTELATVVVDIVGTVKDLAQQMSGSANEVVDTVSNLAKTSSLIMLIVKAALIIIEYVYKALDNAGEKIREEIDLIDKELNYLDGMFDRIDFDLLNNITEKEILKRELNERLQILNEFQAKYAQTAEQLGEKASRTWGEGWLSSMSFGTTALVSAVENAFKGDWGEAGKALANSLLLGVVGWVEGLIKFSRKKDLGNWLDTLAVKEEYIIKLNEILNSNLTDLQKSAEVTAANIDYQIGKLTEKYERYQELAEKGKAKEEDLDALDEAEQELFDRQRERAMVYANTISEQYGDIFNDLADGITSALEGAWENLTDPAKAFEEAWTESIKSVIFNMLKINYIMPQLQEWMKSFYLAMGLNSDGTQITGVTPDMTLTEREAADLRHKYNTIVGITEDAWNTLVGTLDALGVKTGDMSELSKGIQGVTENTAEALEALLNSIRYRIFSHYNYVEPRMDTIIDKLTVSNTIGQQILLNTGEMRTTLNSMLTAFNSVLTQTPGTNGIGIRVYANM